mgnify:CR=1 FL=1
MKISLNTSPYEFPLSQLVESGIWGQLSQPSKAVLGVLWDFHRRFPNSARPSRETIAKQSGVSPATVSRTALPELLAMGLVEVIASQGPRTNTYKVKWTEIVAPEPEEKAKLAPYKNRGARRRAFLGDQTGQVLWATENHGHTMPDGCRLRSAKEQLVHAFLVDWDWPHWANVSYQKLGIVGLHDQSTVDFVIGPKLLLEVWGTARNEKGHAKYEQKKQAKRKAVEKAGWKLMELAPGLSVNSAAFVDKAVSHWAQATIDAAKGTVYALDRARSWHKGQRWEKRMAQIIRNAKARAAGNAPADEPHGLLVEAPSEGGPPVMMHTRPHLVLQVGVGPQPHPPVKRTLLR